MGPKFSTGDPLEQNVRQSPQVRDPAQSLFPWQQGQQTALLVIAASSLHFEQPIRNSVTHKPTHMISRTFLLLPET